MYVVCMVDASTHQWSTYGMPWDIILVNWFDMDPEIPEVDRVNYFLKDFTHLS